MHASGMVLGGVAKALEATWLLLDPAAGASRTGSRRYIADFVSKRDRMRASTGAAVVQTRSITFLPVEQHPYAFSVHGRLMPIPPG